jgi:WD40 repeat protein
MLGVCWLATLLYVSPGHTAELTSVALSHDKKTLVLGDRIGNISAWDFQNGERLWHIPGRGRPIRDIAFLSSAQWVIVVDGHDAVSMVYRGKNKLTSLLDYRVALEDKPSVTTAAAFNENGSKLVVAGSHFGEIFLLDVFTFVERNFRKVIFLKNFETRSLVMGLLHSYRTDNPTSKSVLGELKYGESDDDWNDFAWCPKRDRIVGVSRKGYLVVWDVAKASDTPRRWEATFIRQVGSNRETDRSLNGVGCSESGKIVTAGTPSRFGTLQVWSSEGELEYFAQLSDGVSTSETIERIAFDRQARCILSSGRWGYTLWRLTEKDVAATATIRAGSHRGESRSGRPIIGLDHGAFLLLSDEGAWLLDCKSRVLTRSFGPRPSSLKINLR